MATVLTTRITPGLGATVKNAPLSNSEIDNNFLSLNVNKAEIAYVDSQISLLNNTKANVTDVTQDLATKADNSYVNTELAKKVNKAGDSMSGFLSLHSNPTSNLHATPKQYVDTSVSSLQSSLTTVIGTKADLTYTNTELGKKFDKVGGSVTGFVTLHADPTSNMHASTKRYVDTKFNSIDAISTSYLDGLNLATKDYVDAISLANTSGIIGTATRFVFNYRPLSETDKTFPIPGGYKDIDYLDVFQNGIRLTKGIDYAGTANKSAIILYTDVTNNDRITFVKELELTNIPGGTGSVVRSVAYFNNVNNMQDTFTLASSFVSIDHIDVYQNGVRLLKEVDYTVNSANTTVTLLDPCIEGDRVAIVVYTDFGDIAREQFVFTMGVSGQSTNTINIPGGYRTLHQLEVFHNGVRLNPGLNFTNNTAFTQIILTPGATVNDVIVIFKYPENAIVDTKQYVDSLVDYRVDQLFNDRMDTVDSIFSAQNEKLNDITATINNTVLRADQINGLISVAVNQTEQITKQYTDALIGTVENKLGVYNVLPRCVYHFTIEDASQNRIEIPGGIDDNLHNIDIFHNGVRLTVLVDYVWDINQHKVHIKTPLKVGDKIKLMKFYSLTGAVNRYNKVTREANTFLVMSDPAQGHVFHFNPQIAQSHFILPGTVGVIEDINKVAVWVNNAQLLRNTQFTLSTIEAPVSETPDEENTSKIQTITVSDALHLVGTDQYTFSVSGGYKTTDGATVTVYINGVPLNTNNFIATNNTTVVIPRGAGIVNPDTGILEYFINEGDVVTIVYTQLNAPAPGEIKLLTVIVLTNPAPGNAHITVVVTGLPGSEIQSFGEHTFEVTGGFNGLSQLDVFQNGIRLKEIIDYTGVNRKHIKLTQYAARNDRIDIIKHSFTEQYRTHQVTTITNLSNPILVHGSGSGQRFNELDQLDVYHNGVMLDQNSDYYTNDHRHIVINSVPGSQPGDEIVIVKYLPVAQVKSKQYIETAVGVLKLDLQKIIRDSFKEVYTFIANNVQTLTLQSTSVTIVDEVHYSETSNRYTIPIPGGYRIHGLLNVYINGQLIDKNKYNASSGSSILIDKIVVGTTEDDQPIYILKQGDTVTVDYYAA